jgi:hypothetical protein
MRMIGFEKGPAGTIAVTPGKKRALPEVLRQIVPGYFGIFERWQAKSLKIVAVSAR